jgi:type I restriction enzyme, S subunit
MSARKAIFNDANSEAAPAPLSSLAKLPAGWEWSRIGDICRTTSGGTPSRKNSAYFAGSIPWVKSGELPDGVVAEIEECITEKAVENSSAKLFPAGTLLIALYGATVGKLGILKEDATTNQAVCAIFPSKHLDTKYLFWYLRFVRADLVAQAIGGAQPNISQGILRTLPIPVAPLDQQKHIVAEIEKQFSRLDEAVANLKRVKANLKRYKAAVLKAAVEGRLVETEAELVRKKSPSPLAGGGGGEGASYETGAQLLQRILETRRSQWKGKGKYKEPVAPDTTDLPELPEGWVWVTAEQLTDENRAITYGVIKLGDRMEGGVPVLRSSDVRQLRIDLDNVKRISPEIDANYRRTVLSGGEVVMTVRGTLGGVSVVPPQCSGYNVSREVAMLALVQPPMASLVAFFIASPPLIHWLMRRTKGIAYTGINIETLKALPIPIPPIAEQQRLVAEIDRRLSLVYEVEVQVQATFRRVEFLRRTILASAFGPRLVSE